ncbi:hypothetical protein OG323_37320 (plasmid) [Streptomyces cyaneofuscatus]|uniref:hypothetical protein n=1 Tax=Streptomyces cyaneofuscatus TaxID=66883 RepID=UPI002F91B0D4|nr:hypothetical protein OG323_37320 [Streptomyces cyaneofuscatus]
MADAEQRGDVEDALESAVVAAWPTKVAADLAGAAGNALVVISVDPDAGELLSGDSSGPQLRQYADDVERVRLLYWVSALGTVVVGAFIEV